MISHLERIQLRKRKRFFARRSFSKHTTKEKVIIGIVFVLFLLYAISLIYPFIYVLNMSFKTASDVTGIYNPITGETIPPNYFGFPSSLYWGNFAKAFSSFTVNGRPTNVWQMYFNSISLSVCETLVGMAMTCCAAYVLAKYKFLGNKLIYTVVLIASFIPTVASLPATFELMQDTKLMGTFIGMIILNASAFGGSFLYIHSYFKVVPWSFAESAMMDGASDMRIFTQIMLPLAKNGIVTFTILRFLGCWNEYWLHSLFYGDHPTIAVGIASIEKQEIQFVCAVMVLAIVPTLIFYAIFQKKLLKNTIDGGLK